uniref:Uncharacterized protein n=1 Tax=Heterorhabditis bacteriophora TaxID=37862 RepID=A0A1I7X0D6_HETBA
MLQCEQEMGGFSCSKEAQSRFRSGNFFDFCSARAAHICQTYLISSFGADVVQLLNHQRQLLLQPFEWFCMGPLQQWSSVGRRQSPKDVRNISHLRDFSLRYEIVLCDSLRSLQFQSHRFSFKKVTEYDEPPKAVYSLLYSLRVPVREEYC